MLDILIKMSIFIAAGALWRHYTPGGLTADTTRQAISNLVIYMLLPALVLSVLWQAPLSVTTLKISLCAASGVLACMALAWLSCRVCKQPTATTGTIILASAFPNATYMGLPVLKSLLGPDAQSIAIQYDLFACFPLLLTLGLWIGQHYGAQETATGQPLTFYKIPPLWAALLAAMLNISAVPLPAMLGSTLSLMGGAVIPLMLFSIGLSLRWSSLHKSNITKVVPVVIYQLAIMPVLVLLLARTVGLSDDVFTGVVLEASMPVMLLGIAISDRYGLDTSTYAAGVTLTTLFSMGTIPLWYTVARGF
jgi:predicted permease